MTAKSKSSSNLVREALYHLPGSYQIQELVPELVAEEINGYKYVSNALVIIFLTLSKKHPAYWQKLSKLIKNKSFITKFQNANQAVYGTIDLSYDLTGGDLETFKAKVVDKTVYRMQHDGSWVKLGDLKITVFPTEKK